MDYFSNNIPAQLISNYSFKKFHEGVAINSFSYKVLISFHASVDVLLKDKHSVSKIPNSLTIYIKYFALYRLCL